MAENINPALIGPAKPSAGSSGGISAGRIFKEVAIKAGEDARAAAATATVKAIQKLAKKPVAKMPDVTPGAPAQGETPWMKYALYGVGGLLLIKIVFGGSRD